MKKLIFTFIALWISINGIFAQLPVMVKEISIASGISSYPYNYCIYNNLLFFSANDGINSYGLWVTDGTESGTQLIKYSSINFDPKNLVAFNNKLFFSANNDTAGFELWSSDGTITGTKLFKDLYTGSNSSYPKSLTAMGNKLYFYATSPSVGRELWVSDGTTTGTMMVKDIISGTGSGIDLNYSSPLTLYNNKLYFCANDGVNGQELWVTDGSTPGTQMIKDITPGSASSGNFYYFQVYNNKLYFNADNGTSGAELWVTDGTTPGTVLFKDINPGAVGSAPTLMNSHMLGINNTRLFFTASDGVHGFELWKSDGTVSGTVMVKDILPGHSGSIVNVSYLNDICSYNFKVYFAASDSIHGSELWVSDGTSAGTFMVKDINTTSLAGSSPNHFIVYHGRLYFNADDGTNGMELWRTDGTALGTEKVSPLIVTNSNPVDATMAVYNGALYFGANYNSYGNELWKLDIPYVISTSSLPIAGGTATGGGDFHQGDAVNLIATPNANYTFVNWTENSVEVSTSANYAFTCGAYNRTLVANFQLSVGIDELNPITISISPNPATSELNVYNVGYKILKIYVYDLSGRKLLNIENPMQSNGNCVINISDLQRGLYYINFYGEDFYNTQKFVKL
jgi:ELWxxDGT repeat protein